MDLLVLSGFVECYAVTGYGGGVNECINDDAAKKTQLWPTVTVVV